MNLNEYLNKDITEDNFFDYNISGDESVVEAVIEAISEQINLKQTYSTITFGQLILIEQYLKNTDTLERVLGVVSTFYRPIEEKVFDNTDEELECANKAVFEDLAYGVTLELYDRVLNMRNHFFYEQFNGVVFDKNAQSSHDEDRLPTLEDRFNSIFGWYERQRNISKEMLIPFDKVLDLKASECMVELAYQKMKFDVNYKRNKANAQN
jgi:hypothetical protein